MANPYPWLKFVYNWADSWGVYVEIDDTKRNYFWPDSFLSDTSYEWHIDYKYVANTEPGEVRNADYTIEDFCDKSAFYEASSQEELREDFLRNFEDSLGDTLMSLYGNYHDYHSFYYEFSDYDKITWYKNCLKLAKKEFDVSGLVEEWNKFRLDEIKDNLIIYFKFHYFNKWLSIPISEFLKDPVLLNHLDPLTIHQLYPPILLEDQDKMEGMMLDKCMDMIWDFWRFNIFVINVMIIMLPMIMEKIEKDPDWLKKFCR